MNSVSNLFSDSQNHLGSLPNDLDRMSMSVLSFPAMWSGVSGDTCHTFRRNASARMSWPATFEPRAANRWTQLTVGELSLNNAMCIPGVMLHTSSITSHRKRRPANSRSEFVRCPPFHVLVLRTACFMSGGHLSRNTVGRHDLR